MLSLFLFSYREAHKGGKDIGQVIEVMAEVASRPGTGRSRPGTASRPLNSSRLRDDEETLVFESSPVAKSPGPNMRPGSSLGLRPDNGPNQTVQFSKIQVKPASPRPLSSSRLLHSGMQNGEGTSTPPRTACDKGSRNLAMQKVKVGAVPIFKLGVTRPGTGRYGTGKRPESSTSKRPGTGRAMTPRGIGAMFNKYHGEEPPKTPFTAQEIGGSGVIGERGDVEETRRPETGRHRPEHSELNDLILEEQVGGLSIENGIGSDPGIMETDALPDAPGKEDHSAGANVWIPTLTLTLTQP